MFSRRLWGAFTFPLSPFCVVSLYQLSIPPLSVWNGLEVAPTPFRELYALWQGTVLQDRECVMYFLQKWETHFLVHSTYDHLMSDVLSLMNNADLCASVGVLNCWVLFFVGHFLTSEDEPLTLQNRATEVKKTLRNWLVNSSWDMTHTARSSHTFLRDVGRFVGHNVVSAFVRVWDGRVICRGSKGIISVMTGCSVGLMLHSVVSGEIAELSRAFPAAIYLLGSTDVYRGLHDDWKMGRMKNLTGHVFGLVYGAAVGSII